MTQKADPAEKNEKPRHHHGNLRPALIEAGIAILTEQGLAALTLRKCAARAGVSHAAPAHHFEGLEGLKVAIATEGYARFSQYMRSHAARSAPDARGQLKGIVCGYLDFAQAEPALFDLIFSFRSVTALTQPHKDEAAGAYQILREACAPFVPKGQDPRLLETQVWAMVHGYAQLKLTGRFQDADSPSDEDFLSYLDKLTRPTP